MVKVQQLGLHRLGVRWTSSLYPQIRRGACGVRRETDWIFRELVQCTLNLWSPKMPHLDHWQSSERNM